ncbi:MAG TPA: peptidylprolyl isomerase [Dehalococcoidales bacterium]|nr:peptidylprolyl isomerase [Dehalococcoidales bacterium]
MAKKKKTEKPQREMTRRQLSAHRRQARRQRIVYIGGVAVIAVVVLIVLLGWLLGEFLPLHRTVIRVNDAGFNTGYLIDAVATAALIQQPDDIGSIVGVTARGIEESALVRQGAAMLGITISDDDAGKTLESAGLPVNRASIDLIRTELLRSRLFQEYFDSQVPGSAPQVHIMAMLLESERQAQEIRNRLQNSGNFTALAEEYALNYYSKNVNKGDFGWHPEVVLKEQLGSTVAAGYAFGAEPGRLSQPLPEKEIYKQVGYWLIKVLEKQYEEEAQVQALLITSEEEAENIRARLEAGEELAPLAKEYSHYSPSREKGGELGLVARGGISPAFDEYVFNLNAEIGVWSQPIRDDQYWTQGGYWLIKIVDKDDDRELSPEDKNVLLNQAYQEWVSQLWLQSAAEIDDTRLDGEVQALVVERVTRDLQALGRQA